MTSLTSKIFSSSEYDKLQNLLKHPKEDLQEIIGLLEKKVEAEYKKCKESETELKKTEQRFRSMIEQTTDAVFCYEYNPSIPINLPIDEQVMRLYEGILVDCNLVCARSYGASQVEDVLGRKLTDLFGTTPNSLDKLFKDLIEGGYSIIDGVGIEKLPNGEERYFLNNGHSVIEDNKLVRVWGTFRDITDRKKAEEILYHEQDLIHTLLDNHPDFIYFKDSEARFQHISKRFCDLFKLNKEDIIGKTDLALFPEEVAEQTHTEDLNIIKTGVPLINKEETDGEIWVLTTKMPWLDNDGTIKGLFGISRDITDLKKAEQNIKESEEKYRNLSNQYEMLLESITDSVFALNRDWEYILVNKSAEKINNISRDKIIGNRMQDLFPNIEETPFFKVYESVMKTKNEERIIESFTHLDGETRFYDLSVYPIQQGILCISKDVTEERKIQQELEESEERYRGLINNITDIIYELDIKGKCTYVSNQLFEISGFHPEEILGKNLFQYLHQEDFSNITEKVKEAFNSGIRVSADFRLLHKDGYYVPVSSNFNVIRIKNEQRFIGVLRDNTEKRKAELKLRESEEKYRVLFDNSPVGIGLSTIDGKALDNNDAMVDLTGFSAEELTKIGTPSIYVDPNERSKILNLLREFGKLHDYEVKLRRKDNTEFFGSVSFDLIELGGEKIIQTSLRDITKSKNAELELIKLNTLKSELLRRTSHELKTPLVSIKGFSDLLLELHREKLDDYVVSTLNEIQKGCVRLENLISDILKTAELESGTIQARKSEENLSFLIKLCVNELKGLSELRKQTINIKILEPLFTLIEKEEIHQVISNILSNAIKYTPPNGTIEIRSEIQDNSIIISVKDTGMGFTEEEKDRIFKQFGKIERYGQGMDIVSEGSGLGLYISKKILELHGGKIWVESEGRNKGSTFYFSLPLTENF